MKKITLAIAACIISGGLFAQESRFSAGLELAMPMGDWSDFVGFGFGATLGYEMPVGDNLGIMAQAGYISFSAKDIEVDLGPLGTATVEGKSMGAIPIQVGAKYYFSDNQEGAYLGLLAGFHMLSSEGSDGESNIGVAPLIGFMVGEHIDIGLRYQMLFDKQETVAVSGTSVSTTEETVTNSYLGVRAAYMFGDR
jgi:hypothetical protein